MFAGRTYLVLNIIIWLLNIYIHNISFHQIRSLFVGIYGCQYARVVSAAAPPCGTCRSWLFAAQSSTARVFLSQTQERGTRWARPRRSVPRTLRRPVLFCSDGEGCEEELWSIVLVYGVQNAAEFSWHVFLKKNEKKKSGLEKRKKKKGRGK